MEVAKWLFPRRYHFFGGKVECPRVHCTVMYFCQAIHFAWLDIFDDIFQHDEFVRHFHHSEAKLKYVQKVKKFIVVEKRTSQNWIMFQRG